MAVDFVSVEMPSVLLMAAVRNVQIVCATITGSFFLFLYLKLPDLGNKIFIFLGHS